MSSTYVGATIILGGVTFKVGSGSEYASVVVTYPVAAAPYITAVFTRHDATTLTITAANWMVISGV